MSERATKRMTVTVQLRPCHMVYHCKPTMLVIILMLFCQPTSSAGNVKPSVRGANTRATLSADIISHYFDVIFVNRHAGPCVRVTLLANIVGVGVGTTPTVWQTVPDSRHSSCKGSASNS